MGQRLITWSDSLARDGELFIVLSTNAADRMTYVRQIPALQIDRIDTHPDDIEHETAYHQITDDPEGQTWPNAHEPTTRETDQAMLHYAINRPPGGTRGVGDIEPLLPWLSHYDTWLRDRVRLNRYRTAYLWHVTLTTSDAAAVEAARARYRTPPTPGSVIITNDAERWEALSPTINAADAETDGHALRMLIAAGAGLPLHYLAEPGDANRATADAMDRPTIRRLQRRQATLEHILNDIVATAARRAGRTPPPPLRLPDLTPPTEAPCTTPTPSANDTSSPTPEP
jgi:hypothetical protein